MSLSSAPRPVWETTGSGCGRIFASICALMHGVRIGHTVLSAVSTGIMHRYRIVGYWMQLAGKLKCVLW